MVGKKYFKSTGKFFFKHIVRMISISAIFIVSIGLMSGLGVVKYNMQNQINIMYKQNNVHDLRIRDLIGFSSEVTELYDHLNKNRTKYNIKNIEYDYSFDYLDKDNNDYSKRVCYKNFDGYENNAEAIDKLKIVEGNFPHNEGECIVLKSTNEIKEHKVGDILPIPEDATCLNYNYYKVVGIVTNPTVISKYSEPGFVGGEEKPLSDGIYCYVKDLQQKTAIMITFDDTIRSKFNCISDEYITKVKEIANLISKSVFDQEIPLASFLTLSECFSFASLKSYADKVQILSIILIVFFTLITLLVVYSTMSRLLDEDHGSMAVLKTLGYSNFAIAMRYVAFVFIAGLLGSLIAIGPSILVNRMIIGGFMIQYSFEGIKVTTVSLTYLICVLLNLVTSTILTSISAVKAAHKSPVQLLMPKTPKVGKTILLEKINFIWDKLSFKYKSTSRNVFLFKDRFFMTFISIIASTSLVFTSLGLFNNSFVKSPLGNLMSIRIISLVLLSFSALLCMLVIYNITNINVSERTREIATLKVLGYRRKEVNGYIYREIYIMVIISLIFGLPAGVGFAAFLFNLMGFGSLGNIQWWSYILTIIFTLLFTFLATLLLKRKIENTDMNDSLKTLE